MLSLIHTCRRPIDYNLNDNTNHVLAFELAIWHHPMMMMMMQISSWH
jgi:hypothetical protein